MDWQTLDDKKRIRNVLESLVSAQAQVVIQIDGIESPFTTKFIKIEDQKNNGVGSKKGLIIEKLLPEQGNELIQLFPEVVIKFLIQESLYRCILQCLGISTIYPYYGFFMGFPDYLEIKEKRRDERFVFQGPELISAEFKLGENKRRNKLYQLKVHDYSKRGLGLIITQKDFDLMKNLRTGDKIEEISFYAPEAIIKSVDGYVRHITKMKDGENEGCYILGIESTDIVEINESAHTMG
jgi:hypothetical protein